MKHKIINNYTKESMKALIKKYNNGTKAETECFACLYITHSGNRCAVGCFIPDEYIKGLNNYAGNSIDLLYSYPDLIDYMPLIDDGLTEFQKRHDSYSGNFGLTLHETLFKFIDDECEE